MKIQYFMEVYQGHYQVKSKFGNELWGSHDTQDAALKQIEFLEQLKNPGLFKQVVLDDAE